MAIYSDTFTDTSGTDLTAHTGDSGATWVRDINRAMVISDANRARGSAALSHLYDWSVTPADASYKVSADLYVVTVKGRTGIMARKVALDDAGYRLRYAQDLGAWQFERVDAGVATVFGTYTQTLSASTAYGCEIQVEGSTIRYYTGGTLRLTQTDTTYAAAGVVGLYTNGDGATLSNTLGIHIDNLSFDDALTSGGTTHDGAAVLSGVGAATIAPALTTGTGATLTGSGAMTTAPGLILPGASVLAGTGTLAAAAERVVGGAAALSGAGTLSGVPGVTLGGATMLGGAGTLAVAPAASYGATAALAGAGTFASTPGLLVGGAVALAGVGTLASVGRLTLSGVVSLAGTGALAALPEGAGAITHDGAAALAGAGMLTASAGSILPGATVLAGAGTLSATGQRIVNGTVVLLGAGTLSGAGALALSGQSVLSGASVLAVDSVVTVSGWATLAGVGMIVIAPELLTGGVPDIFVRQPTRVTLAPSETTVTLAASETDVVVQ